MQWIERPLRASDTVRIARGAYATDVPLADFASLPPQFRRLTDTDYTLEAGDAGRSLVFVSADPVTVTVPADFVGIVRMIQAAAGTITVAGDDGVTVVSLGDQTDSAGQWATVYLESVAVLDATFLLTGDTV